MFNRKIALTNSLASALKFLFIVGICSFLITPFTHAETINPSTNADNKKQRVFLIGFAQDTMRNDWRIQQVKAVKKELAKHKNIRFISTDARGQTAKQILDIKKLVKQGIDLLITSPRDAKALAPIVSDTFNKGIPVILLDRKVENNDYTIFIAPDNLSIGKQAGVALGEKLKGKGRVVILEGIPTSTPAIARSEGFKDGLSSYPDISIVATKTANFLRAEAIQVTEEVLKSKIAFDAIYAHSDSMATGARMALNKAGMQAGAITIIGIDYIKEAREAIRNGEQEASFTYPTGGKEGARYAVKILNGKTVPKRIQIRSVKVDKSNVEKVKPIF